MEHSTIYRYDGAVYLDPHTFRLRPRVTGRQRLLPFGLRILPLLAGTAECPDQDGNLVPRARFSAAARRPDASIPAWAEVHLPRVGWRGLPAIDGTVEVAAPLTGLSCGSRMETYLPMNVEAGCCV